VSLRPNVSREALQQVATHLLDLRRTFPHSQAQALLGTCAQGLEALAAQLPRERQVPILQQPCVLSEAREVAADLGIPQRSAAMLLAILLVSPGTVHSVHRLAGLMGLSTTSVRVFACTLRKWLAQGGMMDAVECRWGVGYVIDEARGTALETEFPSLHALVEQLREAEQPLFTAALLDDRLRAAPVPDLLRI
jgi:hypothetical protein